MFNVCRVEDAEGSHPKKTIIATSETREQAQQIIEQEIKNFAHSGRNDENDYWWGRNDDARAVRFFVEGA